MRMSTPADLLLRLYEIRRHPGLRRARPWLLTDFAPAGWAGIEARGRGGAPARAGARRKGGR
jgi:hypothetical protein